MQASGLPLMDNSALHAFGGMAGLPLSGVPPVMMSGNMTGSKFLLLPYFLIRQQKAIACLRLS